MPSFSGFNPLPTDPGDLNKATSPKAMLHRKKKSFPAYLCWFLLRGCGSQVPTKFSTFSAPHLIAQTDHTLWRSSIPHIFGFGVALDLLTTIILFVFRWRKRSSPKHYRLETFAFVVVHFKKLINFSYWAIMVLEIRALHGRKPGRKCYSEFFFVRILLSSHFLSLSPSTSYPSKFLFSIYGGFFFAFDASRGFYFLTRFLPASSVLLECSVFPGLFSVALLTHGWARWCHAWLYSAESSGNRARIIRKAFRELFSENLPTCSLLLVDFPAELYPTLAGEDRSEIRLPSHHGDISVPSCPSTSDRTERRNGFFHAVQQRCQPIAARH